MTKLVTYIFGGSRGNQREPTQIWGEHANSTPKDPSRVGNLFAVIYDG